MATFIRIVASLSLVLFAQSIGIGQDVSLVLTVWVLGEFGQLY